MSNELTLPERAAVALGSSKHEKELILLVEESKTITEIKNTDGRTQCHAARMRLKNSRIAIDKTADAAVEDAKAFTKAVKSEKDRLIAITSSEEDRLQSLQDQWDADREAERQAKIEAERKRITEIQASITTMRNAAVTAAGKSTAWIADQIALMRDEILSADFYQEFEAEANKVHAAAIAELELLHAGRVAAEQEAARLKAEQEAEATRIKTEREELARQRAEADEQRREDERKAAAEWARKEGEMAVQRAEIEREAAEERRRLAAEQAAAQAELKAAQDRFTAEQEEIERANTAARQKLETERAELERAQAMIEQARLDKEAEDQRIAEIHAAEERESLSTLAHDNLPREVAEALFPSEERVADVVTILDNDDPVVANPAPTADRARSGWHGYAAKRPTDDAIIACIAETFNVPDLMAVDYLRAMDLDALRARLLIVDEQPA